jgi:hypothetical protein
MDKMNFKEFLNEGAVYKNGGHTTYSNHRKDYVKINDASLVAVKAALKYDEVEKKIKAFLNNAQEDVSFDGKMRVYGTYKDGKEVIAYLPFVASGVMTKDLIADYKDEFEVGDEYYTNWCAIVNLNSGKVIDVTREDDNEIYYEYSDAVRAIKGEQF